MPAHTRPEPDITRHPEPPRQSDPVLGARDAARPGNPNGQIHLDTPTVPPNRPPRPEWGSDVVAEMLRRLGVEYVALNPGASFKGVHDSLVNYNGNERPGIILCNHEEVAVALAHGYAKLRGHAMGAFVHSNVGLLHATMGIFNAWVDRVPVLVLGATGPMDATQRRPWADWMHTSFGQGQVVRDYTKWENQPASVAALPEAMLRAWQVAHVEPSGPVYVCFDAGLQEQALDAATPPALPDVSRFPLPPPPAAPAESVARAARWLVEASFPVLLLGRVARTPEAWQRLVRLAESLGAAVLTDIKSPASFPTSHPLHQMAPKGLWLDDEAHATLREADVVLALERIDPAGTLRAALPAPDAPWPRLVNVSLEPFAVRSWAADYQELPPADLPILANADHTVEALLAEVERLLRDLPAAQRRAETRTAALHARRRAIAAGWEQERRALRDRAPLTLSRTLSELRAALGPRYADTILARIPLTWARGVWDFERPDAFLGLDGGAGIGSGPGMAVGTALAARGSQRMVVAVLGDGDVFMAPQALWTAAHHRIPLLVVVANNQSYFNDEEHQHRVARTRGRPVENRWVGQRMDEPPVDFARLASGMGVEGFGPVAAADGLAGVFGQALAAVEEGRPALVDVRMATT